MTHYIASAEVVTCKHKLIVENVSVSIQFGVGCGDVKTVVENVNSVERRGSCVACVVEVWHNHLRLFGNSLFDGFRFFGRGKVLVVYFDYVFEIRHFDAHYCACAHIRCVGIVGCGATFVTVYIIYPVAVFNCNTAVAFNLCLCGNFHGNKCVCGVACGKQQRCAQNQSNKQD